MQPFRMAWTGARDPAFAALVVGHRQAMPDPVDDTARSWFCFIFHDPVEVLASDGMRRLPSGAFLLAGPGDRVVHRPLQARLQRSWLRCEGTAVPHALARAGLSRRQAGMLSPPDAAVDALLGMHRAMLHPRGVAPGHLHALFTALLHVLARDADTRPAPADIAAVRRHLESAYMLPPRVDALAAMAGCSRAQFCRRFRAATGLSPGGYVLRLRLEAARELLRGTDRPIPDIAAACGFSDRFHFGRIFAREVGEPPAAFRRHREDR